MTAKKSGNLVQMGCWSLAVLLLALSASAEQGNGCGTSQPLNRTIVSADVEGETAISAIYRFAHLNGVCIGLVISDSALLRPVSRRHFGATSPGHVLRTLLPLGYRVFEQGRVVIIEPVSNTPRWLSQKIPRVRLPTPEPVRMAVMATLYMNYEMARDPKRNIGFAGDVHGPDPANMIGPLDERNKTMQELLNIIAERSRGGMWVGMQRPVGMQSLPWEFLEYQRPEAQGVGTLRWITDWMRYPH